MARNPSFVGARSSALSILTTFFECIFFANDLGKKSSLKMDKKFDRNPHHPFGIIFIFIAFISVIERSFGRLTHFGRIAARYDKFAGNFFFALCLVAIVAYRL
jgi:hypothetical protein